MRRFPFELRAGIAGNTISRQLFELMVRKRSNLALAADVATSEQLLRLAEQACFLPVAHLHLSLSTSRALLHENFCKH